MPMAIAFPNKWTVIPSVIQPPLNISKSSSMYNGKPVIMFRGNSNGQMTVVAVVSDKRLDLFVQTAYVGIKNRNLATPIDEQSIRPKQTMVRFLKIVCSETGKMSIPNLRCGVTQTI